jgi:hypothetical protein
MWPPPWAASQHNGSYSITIANGSSGEPLYREVEASSSDFVWRTGSYTINLRANNGSNQAVTVVGDISGSSTLSTKTSWTSSSTGDGNGDNTVTVTMACTTSNQYNNRNRLTSVAVNYGYWAEP